MKKGSFLALAAAALAASGCSTVAPPAAANDPDGLLDRMVGKWTLTGSIQGQDTVHDVQAEWVLNHEYVRLHEVSRERSSSGLPAYEAIVLLEWDKKSNDYSCLWLDNTVGGGLSNNGIARGKRSGESVEFIFFPGGRNTFHNTMAYDQHSELWTWVMDGEHDGKTEPFARLTLHKR